MRPLAGEGRMAAIEEACRNERGLDDRLLMERAAAALEECLTGSMPGPGMGRICVLAGRGNNGGDGLALASRLAKSGADALSAVCVAGRQSPERAFRLEEARKAGVEIILWPDEAERAGQAIAGAGVLLDAVSGTGLTSALRDPEASLAKAWKDAHGRKIAIDLPSGFREGMARGDPVFPADETLCLGLVKECLLKPAFREMAGAIRLLDWDIFPEDLLASVPGEALEMGADDYPDSLRPFRSDVHKASRGAVSVFAGSPSGVGAARLCAEASARAGAGLVRLIVDGSIWTAAACDCGGLVVKALGGQAGLSESDKDEAAKASCLVIGPGWGRAASRKALLADILSLRRPVVLDADALNVLAEYPIELGTDQAVLTPHPGEASRLLGWEIRDVLERAPKAATALASSYGCVAILKGNVSWIADAEGRTRAFDASFPPLACAGSGDVLCGVCGGLMARGLGAFDAACAALLLHYRAGREVWEAQGYFMAQDLCKGISAATKGAEGGNGYVR